MKWVPAATRSHLTALLGVRVLQLLMRQRFDIIHAHLHEGALIGQVLGGLLASLWYLISRAA